MGSRFQALDASCTLNISQVSYGDTVPPIGGEIWTSAYGRCQDRSSLEYRATAKNPKNESLTFSDWAEGIRMPAHLVASLVSRRVVRDRQARRARLTESCPQFADPPANHPMLAPQVIGHFFVHSSRS